MAATYKVKTITILSQNNIFLPDKLIISMPSIGDRIRQVFDKVIDIYDKSQI